MNPIVVAQTGVAGPDLVPPYLRMAGGLLIVLALLAALAWLLRRTMVTRRRSGAMSVETALPLGERRSLVIVNIENRRLLIGLAPGQVSLVTELHGQTFSQAMANATTAETRS